MVRKKYIKNPIFQIFLVLLMTSCGSSGGGSGSGGNVRSNEGPIKVVGSKPNKEIEDKKPEGSIGNIIDNKKDEENKNEIPKLNSDKIRMGISLPKILNFANPNIPKNNPMGEGLVVGVLDSDFLTNEKTIKDKYKKQGTEVITIEKKDKNYTNHGEVVLDTLLDGIKPKVIASSLSERYNDQNIIRFDFEAYKKTLEYMKANDKNGENKLKVFNQSWGTSLSKNDEEIVFNDRKSLEDNIIKSISYLRTGDIDNIKIAGKEVLNFYDEAVNENNALFVWANGNRDNNDDTLSQPELQAAVPKIKNSLEKGWISVVGVDGSNMNNDYAKHLAYSGVASNWSISASGNAKNSDKIGSSFAAPKVSNAAVQVGSKFDWMTNNDVRLTLFTTTNRIGVGDVSSEENRYIRREADLKYGWGALNTERALKGPGAFLETILKADRKNLDDKDFNYYFTANIPENKISYFENKIHGDSGLKKLGKGTLVLTDENKYSKKSKIEEGTLEIYKIHESGIDVEKNGTLVLHNDSVVGYHEYDFGDILADYRDVVNRGTIKLTGKEAYVGNYKNENGKLYLNEGSHLNVLKEADINNLSVNINTMGYVSPKEEKKVFLEAEKLVGDIKDVEINGMRKVKLDKVDNKLVASISRENAVKYLGDVPESSKNSAEKIEITMKELDEKYNNGTLTEKEKEIGTTILTMSNDNLKKATEVISGEIYASAQALNFVQSQNVNRSLSNHLASLKDFYESDYEWQGWASFQTSDGKLEKSGYASADTKIDGGQFGIDKKIGNNQVGISVSYSKGYGNFEKYAGKYRSDSTGISLYGKRYYQKDFYTLGRVGITSFDTIVERSLLTGSGQMTYGKINHRDTMLSSYLEVGRHFKYITPYVGYSIDFLRRGDFSENNASWGIVADDKDYIKQNLVAGLQGEYKISDIILSGHLTQQVNIGDRDLSFKGRFTDGSTTHTFKGINQIKNTSWIGAGVSKEIKEDLGISFNVDVRLEEYKNTDTVYTAKIYYRF